MQRFSEIYKRKLNESEVHQETKVAEEFKSIYGAMLEFYGLRAINNLNEESKLSFLTELNRYWTEEEGLTEKGQAFLQKRSMSLNENSTAVQKKNYLRSKSYAVINETLRQSKVKYKLYDAIDEIYTQTAAKNITEILSPDTMYTIILESFNKAIANFMQQVNTELNESVKAVKHK